MKLTNKQNEYIKNATHRWNFKVGATGSGKTFMDTMYTIPNRIIERKGLDGLNVILGNTKGTIQRNIIEPLQELYTTQMVTDINADNTCTMFGEKVYCLGADKINQVSKIQGSTMKYVYGDEMTTWKEGVFEMLKSRLRKDYSIFDGTMNPNSKKHFMKKFIDSDADVYCQNYTIDDNPTLPKDFVEQLKKEYKGTVYYTWYILGQWANAEGLIFQFFADNPKKWIISFDEYKEKYHSNIRKVFIGIDIGGTSSHTTFIANGIVGNYEGMVRMYSKKLKHAKGTIDPEAIYSSFEDLYNEFYQLYGVYPDIVFADCAEQVIINGLRAYCRKKGIQVGVQDCAKYPGEERIRAYTSLLNTMKILFVENYTEMIIDSLSEVMYDDKEGILDNGTCDVDTWDGDFYSFSYVLDNFIRR